MNKQNIIIAGSGFAGVWAAAAAARAVALAGQEGRVGITVVSPAPRMVIRPRLYEAVIENMEPDVLPLFDALGVRHMAGRVVEIRAEAHQVVVDTEGTRLPLSYDRFVLAAGSQLFAPPVPGLAEHALNVDQIEGARAHLLGAQLPGRRDEVGRVFADAFLQAEGAADILVTGDMAHALTDDLGNVALMSCQHALSLGRVAGYNAAAGLLGLPLHPYSQPKYVTCLDLGPWGALYTEGWDRQVCLTREEGKALKREINTRWIYPPAPDREAVFAVANPDFVIVP